MSQPGRPYDDGHPDAETLRRFLHGRLDGPEAEAVERHVGGCEVCCRILERLPDDRLVGLLRRREAVALLFAALAAAPEAGCGDQPEPLRVKGAGARGLPSRLEDPSRKPGQTPGPRRR